MFLNHTLLEPNPNFDTSLTNSAPTQLHQSPIGHEQGSIAHPQFSADAVLPSTWMGSQYVGAAETENHPWVSSEGLGFQTCAEVDMSSMHYSPQVPSFPSQAFGEGSTSYPSCYSIGQGIAPHWRLNEGLPDGNYA